MLLRISLATMFLATTACVVDEGDELDDLPLGEVSQGAAGCPPWLCANAATVDGIGFHELHEGGLDNAQGFKLLGFQNGLMGVYGVDVSGGVLRAIKPGFPPVSGAGLIGPGKWLIVRRGATVYKFIIDQVATAAFYPLPSGNATTYRIKYKLMSSTDQQHPLNVCSSPAWGDENNLMGMQADHLVLFEGDRFDSLRLVESAETNPAARTWFNIGCATHILAKMHMTHHTFASKTPVYSSVPPQRTAQMKMYAADYCGIGQAFTEDGTALGWADAQGWFDYAYDPLTMLFEARWTQNGASCLEQVRFGGTSPEFPAGVWPALIAACGPKLPPKCSTIGTTDFSDFAGATLISGFPL
jgi:hypothetical protein